MEAAILIPVGTAKVRDPKTKNYLAEEGEVKPLTGAEGRYWRRRIRNGSVMIKTQRKRTTKLSEKEEEKNKKE